jgi:hypothetical protein
VSIPLLLLMAVAFVAPAWGIHSWCGTCAMPRSPAHWAAQGLPVGLVMLVPVYLCAALLALLTAVAVTKRKPGFGLRQLGLLVVALFACTVLVSATLLPAPYAVASVAATLCAGALLRRANGREAWLVWERLLCCFGVIATCSVPSLLLAKFLAEPTLRRFGCGTYVFFGTLASLLVVLMWPAKKRAVAP